MAIESGPLRDVQGVGDPVSVLQDNLETLNKDVYMLTPTRQSNVETGIIGPPASGAWVLNQLWVDALGGQWVCTVAGSPGTWSQIRPAVYDGEPSSGTIPVGYAIWDSSDGFRPKTHDGGYSWSTITNPSVEFQDTDRMGFTDPSETTIAFDGTNLFTLGDAGSGWSYYRNGAKKTISGDKTVTLPGAPVATGHWFVYIDADDGTLSADQVGWDLEDDKMPIASVWFNDSLTPKYWVADERHTCLIDKRMHYYLHHTAGAVMSVSPTLSGYTVLTDTDTAKTFAVSTCTLMDQDIINVLAALSDPDGTSTDYVVVYRTGASSWAWAASAMPFKYTGAGYIEYDNAGTMTAGANNKFYTSYLAATNYGGALRFAIIPGRGEYANVAAAEAEDPSGFSFAGLEIDEMVILYRLVWQTSSSYTGKGKVTLSVAPMIVTAAYSGVSAGTSHNSLAGLQGGAPSEYYHLDAASYAAASQGRALKIDTVYTAGASAKAKTGVVGYLHPVDLSGATGGALNGNVVFTLPATAALGDRCGVTVRATATVAGAFATAPGYGVEIGSTTIAGVAHTALTGGTSQYGLWLIGEMIIFRCVDATGPKWVVDIDKRIMHTLLTSSNAITTNSAGTLKRWDLAAASIDNAGLQDVSNDRAEIKRVGLYKLVIGGSPYANVGDQKYYGLGYSNNGSTFTSLVAQTGSGANTYVNCLFSRLVPVGNGALVYPYFVAEAVNVGLAAATPFDNWFHLLEQRV